MVMQQTLKLATTVKKIVLEQTPQRDKKEIFPRLSRSHRDRKRIILINKLILIAIIFLIYQ
jgi:hypothetical protein